MDDIFDDKNAIKSLWVKWGKIGDRISGTLIDVREMNSQLPGKEGERVKVYDIQADSGEFHDMDNNKVSIEPAIVVEVGGVYSIGGRKAIDQAMRRIRVGQKVGLKLTDIKESKKKGFSALKIIKVYAGEMDNDWMAGNEVHADGE
jgi:hypothetical protein